MNHSYPIIAAILLGSTAIHADLATDLVIYYDFNQSDSKGLINKAPDASDFDAVWAGGTRNLSQTGFTGDAEFSAPDGTSDRGTLLVGNALNIVDAENSFLTTSIGSSDLGNIFTISVWSYLAPGESNGSNRFHIFEAKNGVWDVSWGTTSTVNTTDYDDYAAFVETTSTAPISDLAPFAWQHALLEYDLSGANPTVSVYINGSSTPVVATDTSGTFSFAGLNIGRHRDTSGDRDWDGMLDEFAIWNRALTEEERTEVYTKGSIGAPIITPSLLYVEISALDPSTGSVTGAGAFQSGQEASIAAIPEPGYLFSEWIGDFAGQPASFTYNVTADVSASAVFGQDTNDDDADGLSNYEEVVQIGSSPDNSDTDGDGIPDGDEWSLSFTDPLVDDSALIAFVRENLCESAAGVIQLNPPGISTDPTTGDVTLSLSFSGSANQENLILLTPQSVTPIQNGWEVTLPAPSSSVNSYILKTQHP